MLVLNIIALLLMVIGSLNLGLIGFFNYDVLGMIFGQAAEGTYSGLARFIFAIIGLAGVWGLSFFGRSKFLGQKSSGCCNGKNKDHHGNE